jgi:hypothetical protein
MNNKIKLLSALMWLLAGWELLNALGSSIFLNLGAALYGWTNYVDANATKLTVNVFHQYAMVLYVLAVGYAVIATDVVKYEKLIWMVVVEQIVGAIFSTYEVLNAEQIINWSNFTLVHTPQGIIVVLLWFLRPSADSDSSAKVPSAA